MRPYTRVDQVLAAAMPACAGVAASGIFIVLGTEPHLVWGLPVLALILLP